MMFPHRFFTVWKRQTQIGSLVFHQSWFLLLLQRRTNSKNISNDKHLDTFADAVAEKSSLVQTVSFSKRIAFQLLLYNVTLLLPLLLSQWLASQSVSVWQQPRGVQILWKELDNSTKNQRQAAYNSSFHSHGSDLIPAVVEIDKNVWNSSYSPVA